MEVLSIELGRSVQLVVADEVKSPAGSFISEAARLVTDRYGFAIMPDLADSQKTGLKFKEGRLVSGNRMINIRELGIFNDGITVDTYNTSDSDFVIDDIIPWARQTFGLRKPKTIIGRKYISHIVAELDNKAGNLLPAFKMISDAASLALKEAYNVEIPIELSGASWGSDINPSPATVLSAEFNFHRRISRPYSESRFFFIAPVPTDIHIRWIETVEAALLGS
jgi:hypothetical protein